MFWNLCLNGLMVQLEVNCLLALHLEFFFYVLRFSNEHCEMNTQDITHILFYFVYVVLNE